MPSRSRTSTSRGRKSVCVALICAVVASVLVLAAPAHAAQGAAYAWGRNADAQVGDGSTTQRLSPVAVSLARTDVTAITGGFFHGIARMSDGTTWTWGRGNEGQLGDGTQPQTPRLAPAQLVLPGDVAFISSQIDARAYRTVATSSSGAVYWWGWDGFSTVVLSPTAVLRESDDAPLVATQIAAGYQHSLALTSAGVYAWGGNMFGQLGTGEAMGPYGPNPPTVSHAKAVPVTGLPAGIVQVAAGDWYSAALDGSGNVWTWGYNGQNALGAGRTVTAGGGAGDANVPVAVLDATTDAPLTGITQISAGSDHMLALAADGSVYMWGDGGTAEYAKATEITVSGTVGRVFGGDFASFLMMSDGSVQAWGSGSNGQLGLGDTTNRTAPTVVTALSGVQALGGTHLTHYAIAGPAVSIAPPSLDFGDVLVGETSPSMSFTITNTGHSDLSIASVSFVPPGFEGPLPPPVFGADGYACESTTLAPGSTCEIGVTFTPPATGSHSDTLYIRSNAAGSPATASLTGVGVAGAITGLALTSGLEGDTGTGVTKLGIADVPPSLIPDTTPPTQDAPLGRTPLGRTPLGRTPLGRTPLGRTPLGRTELGTSPLGRTPLGRTPLSRTPLGRTDLDVAPLGRTPLGRTLLSQYPLLTVGGWTTFLSQTQDYQHSTPQSVTLAEFLSDPSNAADNVALQDINIAFSPLADLSLLSFLLDGVQIADLPDPAALCSEVGAQGYDCATDPLGQNVTMLELELRGVALDETSLASYHIGDIDTTDALFPHVTILGTDIRGTAFAQIPLGPADGGVLIDDCSLLSGGTCAGHALGEAGVFADRLTTTGTFASLGARMDAISLSQLIIVFVDRSSLPWDLLDLDAVPVEALAAALLAGGSNDINFVPFAASFSVPCSDVAGLDATVRLADGFRYRPGSSQLSTYGGTPVAIGDPVAAGGELSWSLGGAIGCEGGIVPVQLSFEALAPQTIGVTHADVTVGSDSIAPVTLADQAPVLVVSSFEPNDAAPGTSAATDTLLVGQIDTAGDRDTFNVSIPAGKVVRASLSGLERDLDLVAYYPAGADDLAALRGATPFVLPFGELPLDEPGFAEEFGTPPPGVLQDLHLESGLPLAAYSSFRGTDPEQLSFVSKAGAGAETHTFQVTGYDGAHGPEAYVLRISVAEPATLPPCAPRTFPNAMGPRATTQPPIAPTTNTLFIVDKERLDAQFGAQAADIVAKVEQVAHPDAAHADTSVVGEIAYVDSTARPEGQAVHDAFAALDANPCSPELNNAVVREINDYVDAIRGLAPIRNIVLVGPESVLPHAALDDLTRDGNERDYAADLLFDGNNSLAGPAGASKFRSDDPYGAFHPLSLAGRLVYLPQAAVGRLGEDADAITALLQQFTDAHGLADPTTGTLASRKALEADYDFLSDGGQLVADALAAQLGAGDVTRLTDAPPNAPWTKDQLANEWVNKPVPPAIAGINGHFDHFRALPAAGNATGDESDLFTTQIVQAAAAPLDKRIVFSMGCHSALGVPDRYGQGLTAEGQKRLYDWPQAYADKSTAITIGNLGYGFGDSATVAYTERLVANFASNLDGSGSVGRSLVDAKATYFGSMASFTPVDLKSIQQVILWGLPMYRVPASEAVTASAGFTTTDPIAPDPITGLDVWTTQLVPAFAKTTLPDGTAFYSADDGTHAASGYPIMPKVVGAIPAVSGKVAHGAVPVAATVADPEAINNRFAHASIDSGAEGAPSSDGVFFPESLAHIGTTLGLDGTAAQSLVVVPAQFRSDDNPATPPGNGEIAKYADTQWMVLYSSSSDFTPPEFASAHMFAYDAHTALTAEVSDAGTVKRVFLLGRTAASNTFSLTELHKGAGNSWSGGSLDALVEGIFFAVDAAGNTATHSKKGIHHSPSPAPSAPQPPEGVTIEVQGTQQNGWYRSTPTVVISGEGGEDLSIVVDGGDPQPSPAAISGDGMHVVDIVGDGGASIGGLLVPIDNNGPTIVSSVDGKTFEVNQAVTQSVQCVDGGSGVASCPAGGAVDTSTAGVKAVTLGATDIAGNSSEKVVTYTVTYGDGVGQFLAPVDPYTGPGSVINAAKTSQAIPFKFAVVDANGDPYTNATATGTWTSSSLCTSATGTETIPTDYVTVTSGLRYDPVTQQYVWTLKKGGPAGCFLFTLTLNDGTKLRALFRFK